MASEKAAFSPPTRARAGSIDENSPGFKQITTKAYKAKSSGWSSKVQKTREMAHDFHKAYQATVSEKVFLGAQPKVLRQPHLVSPEEQAKCTRVVCRTLQELVKSADRVLVLLGEDVKSCQAWQEVLKNTVEDEFDDTAPAVVALADSWLHTFPRTDKAGTQWKQLLGKCLFIYIGTPGRYLQMCIRSQLTQEFDDAYADNRLVILCRGGAILPIGQQVENVYGIDALQALDAVASMVQLREKVYWGHGAGTKRSMLSLAYPRLLGPEAVPNAKTMPAALKFDECGDQISFDYFVEYVRYLNSVKLATPSIPLVNFYDTGMLVSVCMGSICEAGLSLLTDHDGLSMLRDASIGHTISKINQVVEVEPFKNTRSVYNIFCGDGAARLNNGMETVMHLIEEYKSQPLITLFLFNNSVWAIEDNLVAHTMEQHTLKNRDFYDLLGEHGNVCVCENVEELSVTMQYLSEQTNAYLRGEAEPALRVVVVRGISIDVPPLLGNLDPILKSSDMAFLRDTLGKFSEGCIGRVPIYGCSAFEYIQFLDIFLTKMPEGRKYQYICGRTDIQAAHMAGYTQPEGKCVLMINDVYGINSLGETLKSLMTGFGGKQLLLMIWHPTLVRVVDHFHLHRPPMVWPSVGPHLAEYFVRTEKDLLSFEFNGLPSTKVTDAIERGTRLIVVNMLPEHERNFVKLDVRIKA